MTARKKHRVIGKIGIAMFETAAFQLDTFTLPVVAKSQEKTVRKLYRQANELARLVGLPAKKYKRIRNRNVVEVIE